MAEAWDDSSELLQPTTNTASFVDAGHTCGKDRGVVLLDNNNDNRPAGSIKSSNDDSGSVVNNNNTDCRSGGWSFGNSRGGGRGGNRNDIDEDNNGFKGGDGVRQNDRDGDNNENTDNKGFRGSAGSRGGSGGSRGGGRGGFGNREADGDGGLSDFGRSFGEKFNGDGEDDENDNNGDTGFDGSAKHHYQPRGRGGRGGSRGGRGGFGNSGENGDGGSKRFADEYSNDCDEDGENGSKPSRGRGGRRDGEASDQGGSNGNELEEEGGQNPDKPPPVTYIPPEISMDDNELFNGVEAGLNFSRYDETQATTTGINFSDGIADFKLMGLRNLVMDNVVKSGYRQPTPIQKRAIPIIMKGRDLMACAQTGSGKIAAFMVPIINDLLEHPSELKLIGGGCEPHCVVLSPTRELAVLIGRQALKFSKDSVIKCCVISEGVATMREGHQVANGCHILVATPGRLIDFINRRRVSFASIRYVVLDEADRMLNMGFVEIIKEIMNHETMVAKGERQTLMFSATFGEAVQSVAADFLDNYLFLIVGINGAACSDVEQSFYEVTKQEKLPKLMELFENDTGNPIPRTIIFVEMKRTADFLANLLAEKKIPATSIHGDRMRQQREEALRDFISGKMRVLVTTAVAALGLDIKDVAHVINFDMPKTIDEYVHRVGRIGRAGNRGKATSFFNFETDRKIIDDLVWVLKSCKQTVPDWLLSGGGTNSATSGGDSFGEHDVRNLGNNASEAAADEQW